MSVINDCATAALVSLSLFAAQAWAQAPATQPTTSGTAAPDAELKEIKADAVAPLAPAVMPAAPAAPVAAPAAEMKAAPAAPLVVPAVPAVVAKNDAASAPAVCNPAQSTRTLGAAITYGCFCGRAIAALSNDDVGIAEKARKDSDSLEAGEKSRLAEAIKAIKPFDEIDAACQTQIACRLGGGSSCAQDFKAKVGATGEAMSNQIRWTHVEKTQFRCSNLAQDLVAAQISKGEGTVSPRLTAPIGNDHMRSATTYRILGVRYLYPKAGERCNVG